MSEAHGGASLRLDTKTSLDLETFSIFQFELSFRFSILTICLELFLANSTSYKDLKLDFEKGNWFFGLLNHWSSQSFSFSDSLF